MDVSLVLPTDVVAAADLSGDTPWRIANIEKLESNEAGYDIGPETTLHFELMLSASQTIIWNGPMGVCEVPEFATGTQAIASIVRDRTEDGTISIIGGGDTASAIKNSGIQDGFSHISTGGGASLQMMSGKTLPAFETLLQYA
jgi:phosphoglycerate kinase